LNQEIVESGFQGPRGHNIKNKERSETLAMSEYLFVGGPHDGKRIALPHRKKIVNLPMPLENPKWILDAGICRKTYLNHSKYFAFPIACEAGEVVVYRYQDLIDLNVIQKLIDGYRNPK
jgi:hypothetical protein